MDHRVSLITLPVQDQETSAAFYEALGWSRVETDDGIVVFDLIGQALGLYDRAALAKELGRDEADLRPGAGIILSYNVRGQAEVGPLLERAKAAGGDIVTAAKDVFWGGHHGHFADPDGHIWEVAWNPFSPPRADGTFQWNG